MQINSTTRTHTKRRNEENMSMRKTHFKPRQMALVATTALALVSAPAAMAVGGEIVVDPVTADADATPTLSETLISIADSLADRAALADDVKREHIACQAEAVREAGVEPSTTQEIGCLVGLEESKIEWYQGTQDALIAASIEAGAQARLVEGAKLEINRQMAQVNEALAEASDTKHLLEEAFLARKEKSGAPTTAVEREAFNALERSWQQADLLEQHNKGMAYTLAQGLLRLDEQADHLETLSFALRESSRDYDTDVLRSQLVIESALATGTVLAFSTETPVSYGKVWQSIAGLVGDGGLSGYTANPLPEIGAFDPSTPPVTGFDGYAAFEARLNGKKDQ